MPFGRHASTEKLFFGIILFVYDYQFVVLLIKEGIGLFYIIKRKDV